MATGAMHESHAAIHSDPGLCTITHATSAYNWHLREKRTYNALLMMFQVMPFARAVS
jgi:hypothetical protein